MDEHIHAFVIPVQWKFYNRPAGSMYIPDMASVTKLRCVCGKEVDRD